ncbi:MAG: hypothetical protein EBU84_14465 [Actinobacteria bacterium]|nr:hypothetical protein [Actinomycetota bacterium]
MDQENLDQIQDDELKEFAQDCLDRIERSAEGLVTTVVTNLLSEGDVIILGMMGIDGRQKILDVLIKQCEKLKKEIENE